MLNIYQKALADGAMTDLGSHLGDDLARMKRANALLGDDGLFTTTTLTGDGKTRVKSSVHVPIR
jgi:hypothetical protein